MNHSAGAQDDRVVITCAITGGASRQDGNPNLPYTPEELAREARRAVDAGAGVIHLHGREPATGSPSHDVAHFADAVEAIRVEVPEVALNLSCGGTADLRERVRPVEVLRPELATLSLGCYNYAAFDGSAHLKTDRAVVTTFATMLESLSVFTAAGTAADLECYEIGHLDNLDVLGELGGDTSHGHLSFVLGVLGSQAADPRYLTYLANRLGPARPWTAIVIDPHRHWQVLGAALGLGGWIRVGFEDCHWLAPGEMATSNGQLVERAARLVRACGREVAPALEARSLVTLPGRDFVSVG